MGERLKDTLLLVGGPDSCRADLRAIFSDNYNILEAENVAQAILLLKQNSNCIALAIMDLKTPEPAEMAVLMEATMVGTDREIPTVAMVDSSDGTEREERAFLMGAADVITKPYSRIAVQKRIQIIMEMFVHKWKLERVVTEQSETIRNANQVMMDTLSAIIEYRSAESGNHVLRIRHFTKILLKEVSRYCPEYELTDELIDIIASASALHDMGKISIPDKILNKPGRLTDEEFEIMKTHSMVGSELVKQLSGMGEELYLRYAYNISLYHHERWDGRGYPCGLKGEEIPICAQVVGLTDAFDALTSKRVYKPAYPFQKAVNMILNGECGEFSPKLLECFKNVRQQMVDLARDYADGLSPKDETIGRPLPGPNTKRDAVGTLQMSQAKYQTLLHYINDTVLDLDLDHDLYHVVYNPNPKLDSLMPNTSFHNIVERLKMEQLHPDDMMIPDAIDRFITEEFFQLKLHRRTFPMRIYSPSREKYQTYELTFLRVNTGEEDRRMMTAIWHKTDENMGTVHEREMELMSGDPGFYGLVSSALRCWSDSDYTIESGTDSLVSLVGYSKKELEEQFNHKLINLIVERDREAVRKAVEEAMRSGEKVEVEFRVKKKGSNHLWVLAKARYRVDTDGQDYLYFAIRDNSESKAVRDQLKADIERNQLLIDQTGSIVFEWDLLSDTMYCSPKWEEHFGYVPISQNYGSQRGIATHFHPDDLILVRKVVEEIKGGIGSAAMEVRIANAVGNYLWMKITAAGRYDENGTLIRIIGILQDIDDLKRATLILEEKAQKDALTKLLNKASTENQIHNYLVEKDPEELSGLLILDLDNFKSVNDTRGHLYGDVVLTQVGTMLRKFFRSQDIIGRIGGDEFMVLLKGIPDQKLLEERCTLLVDALHIKLSELMPELQVSCSVGAALTPDHGTSYNELYKHADEALYHAKNKGKNQYRIYSSQDKYDVILNDNSRTTRIDSDDPNTVTNDSFERFVFRCLYESQDLDKTINELLAFVGTNFNVSRAYIFENNEENTTCSNTFEWCNEGIEPQMEELQGVSYIDDIPGWPQVYNEKGILYCTDITQLAPQFRAILEPQGIKSMLQCAIIDQGVFRGYVGFDECISNRLWTQEQLYQLEFLAEALSVFLIRRRMSDHK